MDTNGPEARFSKVPVRYESNNRMGTFNYKICCVF